MFGNNHVVVNNVVENSTGQALEIGGGEVRDDTTSGTDHEAVDHALVAFNTFVNDHASPIQMGDGGKAFQPSDVTVADNIINLQFAYDTYNQAGGGALDANQADPIGAGESPNLIQKINIVLMGQSILKSGNKSQNMYLATAVSARNMAFRNRYQ